MPAKAQKRQADKLIDQFWRQKIRALPRHKRKKLPDYLGISYFTLAGKLSEAVQGGFTRKQRKLLKAWDGWNHA